jgi:aspartate aminotransferase
MYLLESQNLALLQGEAYGLSPFVRISFATSMETLEEGCRRLRLACEPCADSAIATRSTDARER